MRSPEERKSKRQLGIIFHGILIASALGIFYTLLSVSEIAIIVFIIGVVVFMTVHIYCTFEVRKIEKQAELRT